MKVLIVYDTVLVVNPVIQYSVFEQLKNLLIARRKLHRKGGLTDFDFFVLGALSKLGKVCQRFHASQLSLEH